MFGIFLFRYNWSKEIFARVEIKSWKPRRFRDPFRHGKKNMAAWFIRMARTFHHSTLSFSPLVFILPSRGDLTALKANDSSPRFQQQ